MAVAEQDRKAKSEWARLASLISELRAEGGLEVVDGSARCAWIGKKRCVLLESGSHLNARPTVSKRATETMTAIQSQAVGQCMKESRERCLRSAS